MKRIVSFDVDMTLLDHKDWTIPGSAMKTIEQLRESSYVVLATGRDMDSSYSTALRDQIRPDAIIHNNGTKITVGKELIYEHSFDKELMKEMFAFISQTPYGLGAAIDSMDYYVHPEAVEKHDLDLWGQCLRRFADPQLLLELPVGTLAFFGDEAGAGELRAAFPQVNVHLFPEKRGADVVEIIASKALGLRRLCDYFSVPMSETVAFGDSMNDSEIVQAAGLGIAMGNAMEELKQAADYVTDPIGEDGVRSACLHFGLICNTDTNHQK